MWRAILDRLIFKGGTAIRKLYAGSQGRFSTDLDFASNDATLSLDVLYRDLIDAIDGRTMGPFSFSILMRRDRASIAISSDLKDSGRVLATMLDLATSSLVVPSAQRLAVLWRYFGTMGSPHSPAS